MHTFTIQGNKSKVNQDVIMYDTMNDYQVAVIADGASCHKYALQGAKIACETCLAMIKDYGEALESVDDQQLGIIILDEIRYATKERLQDKAHEAGCTLALVIYNQRTNCMRLMSIGDTVIYAKNHYWNEVLRPVRFGKATTYLTASKAPVIQSQTIDHPVSVVLGTDGFYDCLKFKDLSLLDDEHLDPYLKSLSCYDDCSYIRLDF